MLFAQGIGAYYFARRVRPSPPDNVSCDASMEWFMAWRKMICIAFIDIMVLDLVYFHIEVLFQFWRGFPWGVCWVTFLVTHVFSLWF